MNYNLLNSKYKLRNKWFWKVCNKNEIFYFSFKEKWKNHFMILEIDLNFSSIKISIEYVISYNNYILEKFNQHSIRIFLLRTLSLPLPLSSLINNTRKFNEIKLRKFGSICPRNDSWYPQARGNELSHRHKYDTRWMHRGHRWTYD